MYVILNETEDVKRLSGVIQKRIFNLWILMFIFVDFNVVVKV